jgi:S-adenosylmethionine decarboxylase proenzyme
MDTFGQHLLVEYHGCDRQVLDELDQIELLMRSAAEAAGATVVTSAFHRFAPQGVSGVVVVEESHLSIHTWPERGYAAVDFYTCGECRPERAHEFLRRELRAGLAEVMRVTRGAVPADPGMKVREHYQDTDPSVAGAAELNHEPLVHGNV